MATFIYKGLKTGGGEVEGRISAADEVDALRQLEAQSIAAFQLQEARLTDRVFERRRARPQDRFRFMRQLAMLLRAGAPLLSAFETIGSDEPCRELAEMADEIRRALRSGTRLSTAMRQSMRGFPDYVPRLVELGEATGELPRALNDIATQMEQDLRAASEVRNALAYPSFLAVMGVVAVLFIFLFVVPRFAALLGDDRSQLPGFSRMVIETGVWLRAHLAQSALVLAGAGATLFMLFRNDGFRSGLREVMFRMPVVGSFLRASETARWARIAGTALSGGAPLLEALNLAESAVSSQRWRHALAEVRRSIRAGEPLEEALRTYTEFDSMTINLVKTGRAAASLDEMLLFVAEVYETETRDRAKRLTSLAEPLAILFIASVVGAIVVSLVMAMTSLYDIAI